MANDETNIIIYQTDRKHAVKLLARGGKIWLTQAQIADLFGTSLSNVNKHIANIFYDKELEESAVIEFYSITAADGKTYTVAHYSPARNVKGGFRSL